MSKDTSLCKAYLLAARSDEIVCKIAMLCEDENTAAF